MNLLEARMVELLSTLRREHQALSVKAEFEDEGTRLDEAMRLKHLSALAGLPLALKIGGCAAVRDLMDARSLGAARVIAPMVETPYALKKYLQIIHQVMPAEERRDLAFHLNIETITACHNCEDMMQVPDLRLLQGVVIGRTDLAASLGLGRDAVDSQPILDLALGVAARARARDLQVTVGGGLSVRSLAFLRAFPDGHLDQVETRKIIFDWRGAPLQPQGLGLALEFEWLWLKNKKSLYGMIQGEQDARLERLETMLNGSLASTR